MNAINQPLRIKNITLKNRIGMSPMCMYSAKDGFANDWHYVHYGTRVIGGAGLIIQEATAISPEGRITPYDLGIWNDNQIENLQEITKFIVENGSVPAIQLAHAGRKASHKKPLKGGEPISIENGGWQVIAPSPISFSEESCVPTEVTNVDIQQIIEQFQNAAKRAVKAGYKIIEIHSAHGYLLHEFLSPLSNIRKDNYGGTFENRIRFLLEVISAVQKAIPDEMPLFVRLSVTEWAKGGWDVKDSVKLSEILKTKGVDVIDCSSGGNINSAKIPLEPMYQVPFSEAIKQIGVKTAAVGLISTAEQVSSILQNNQADIVLMGRELLRNPYFAYHATKEKPEQYIRG